MGREGEGRRSRHRGPLALACALTLVSLALARVAPASAQLAPAQALTYIPFGFVHNTQPTELMQETLEQMSDYGIGQMLLPMPNFKKDGELKLSRRERETIPLWASQTSTYDATQDASIVATASFGGKVKGASLDLEEAAVRGRMIGGIEAVLAMGVGGVSLDLEPYPVSQGFVDLLGELDEALARRGFAGGLSITAPATASRWPAPYMHEVTSLVGQVDPLFYDSERKTAAAYEQWVREGLADYSANAAPGTQIVPDLPSYGANRWHEPAVENLATATTALEQALGEGSRVNGAGIFWWWGFYYDEEGEGEYNGAPDRETWLTRTLELPFTA